MLRLGYLGETFGVSPSAYLGEDLIPYERFCIDEAALLVLAQEKKASYEREQAKMKGGRGRARDGASADSEPEPADAGVFTSLSAQAQRAKRELQKKVALKG